MPFPVFQDVMPRNGKSPRDMLQSAMDTGDSTAEPQNGKPPPVPMPQPPPKPAHESAWKREGKGAAYDPVVAAARGALFDLTKPQEWGDPEDPSGPAYFYKYTPGKQPDGSDATIEMHGGKLHPGQVYRIGPSSEYWRPIMDAAMAGHTAGYQPPAKGKGAGEAKPGAGWAEDAKGRAKAAISKSKPPPDQGPQPIAGEGSPELLANAGSVRNESPAEPTSEDMDAVDMAPNPGSVRQRPEGHKSMAELVKTYSLPGMAMGAMEGAGPLGEQIGNDPEAVLDNALASIKAAWAKATGQVPGAKPGPLDLAERGAQAVGAGMRQPPAAPGAPPPPVTDEQGRPVPGVKQRDMTPAERQGAPVTDEQGNAVPGVTSRDMTAAEKAGAKPTSLVRRDGDPIVDERGPEAQLRKNGQPVPGNKAQPVRGAPGGGAGMPPKEQPDPVARSLGVNEAPVSGVARSIMGEEQPEGKHGLYAQGIMASTEKNFDGAKEVYTQLLALGKTDPEAQNLANLLAQSMAVNQGGAIDQETGSQVPGVKVRDMTDKEKAGS